MRMKSCFGRRKEFVCFVDRFLSETNCDPRITGVNTQAKKSGSKLPIMTLRLLGLRRQPDP